MTFRGKSAVVLLSSGLDSSIALAIASKELQVRFALTFDYGQRAAQKEIECASQIAKYFHVPHRSLILPWFNEFRSNALVNEEGRLPRPDVEQLSQAAYSKKSAQAVWVSNRNGVFIECAAAFAEEHDVDHVIVGFNKEEAETFPDNSMEYVEAINHALSFSTRGKVSVVSHTSHLDKQAIVAKAKALHFPFHLLWSCYEGRAQMCGSCESCMRLKRAFHKNEVPFHAFFECPSF